jgi:hypothetical protein
MAFGWFRAAAAMTGWIDVVLAGGIILPLLAVAVLVAGRRRWRRWRTRRAELAALRSPGWRPAALRSPGWQPAARIDERPTRRLPRVACQPAGPRVPHPSACSYLLDAHGRHFAPAPGEPAAGPSATPYRNPIRH